MNASNPSDEWLMGQVILGRRDSLGVLLRRHATPLLTYWVRVNGDEHRSEELLQEIFMTVWVKRKTYKLKKPFRAWLYTIAINRARLEFRKTKGKEMASLDVTPDSHKSNHPSPDDAALDRERASIVNAALAQLPEPQQMVVTLRIWGGLSYAEIAETVGHAESTVRSHMHRALAALRKDLIPAVASE